MSTFSLPKKTGSRSGGIRARNYDLANTNIAGLGTDLEKEVRKAAAETEEAWEGAGKEAGIQIWRIEKFQVKPWPKEKYGRFYSGDSYIVLHTYHKKGQGALMWDAHFWIGRDSSQDEYGTAAYKTVELDDYLDGRPTQYREVQDRESCRFKALFKQLMYLDGGIGTGFNHVEEEKVRSRLLHCKGRMNVVVKEVPISYKSLNSGDSFIFEGEDRIYVWHGHEAGPMEKAKAANIGQALDGEREGTPLRETFDENISNCKEWWHAINGEGPVRTKAEAGNDNDVSPDDKRLMRVSDESGEIKMDLVAQGDGLRRDIVSSSDVFILDEGYEVMVWIGKEASIGERKGALAYAVEYLKRYNLPLDKPVVRIMEGGENEQFEAAFEVGVLSTARPGDGSGATFSANISKFQGHSKAVGASMMGDYKGTGGAEAATDFDALYSEQGVDPEHWKGRSKDESSYAKELAAAKGDN